MVVYPNNYSFEKITYNRPWKLNFNQGPVRNRGGEGGKGPPLIKKDRSGPVTDSPTRNVAAPKLYFGHFPRKLHEIEKN